MSELKANRTREFWKAQVNPFTGFRPEKHAKSSAYNAEVTLPKVNSKNTYRS